MTTNKTTIEPYPMSNSMFTRLTSYSVLVSLCDVAGSPVQEE